MIIEDHVSFETAKLMKEKGFDWECKTMKFFPEPDYDQESPDGVYAPTIQMAMKWLRNVHNIDTSVTPDRKNGYSVLIFKDKRLPFDTLDSYPTYEEACEAAIKYCLENLI